MCWKRQHKINIFKFQESIHTFCRQASPADRIAFVQFSTGSKCYSKNTTELKNVGRFLQLRCISECCGLRCYVGQPDPWSPYSNADPDPTACDPRFRCCDPWSHPISCCWSLIPYTYLVTTLYFNFPLFLRAAGLSVLPFRVTLFKWSWCIHTYISMHHRNQKQKKNKNYSK